MPYEGFNVKAWHFKGKTDKMLVISRNKLTPENKDIVYKDFIETCDYSFARYIKFLAEYTNSQNIDAVEYESFAIPIYMFLQRNHSAPSIPSYVQQRTNNVTIQLDLILSAKNFLQSINDRQNSSHKTNKSTTAFIIDNDTINIVKKEPEINITKLELTDIWFMRDEQGVNKIKDDEGLVWIEDINTASKFKKLYIDNYSPKLSKQGVKCYVIEFNAFTLKGDDSVQHAKSWCWVYRINDVLPAFIQASDYFIKKAVHAMLNKTYEDLFPERPILPGFENFKSLNVHTLPMSPTQKRKKELLYNLGNFFIWPFTYDTTDEIIKLIRNTKNKNIEKKRDEIIKELHKALIDTECVRVAMSMTNPTYEKLISYVSENLSVDPILPHSKLSSEIPDYSHKDYRKNEVRNRYTDIWKSVLIPLLVEIYYD